MPHLIWTDLMNTGIDVIDIQHRRIIDYINMLHDARIASDRAVAENVIDALVDYVISHFGFEEAMLEDAGYEFIRPHKQDHQSFIGRIDCLRQRFKNGDHILDELQILLREWHLNHIKKDDARYVKTVRANVRATSESGAMTWWISKSLERFFRSA